MGNEVWGFPVWLWPFLVVSWLLMGLFIMAAFHDLLHRMRGDD